MFPEENIELTVEAGIIGKSEIIQALFKCVTSTNKNGSYQVPPPSRQKASWEPNARFKLRQQPGIKKHVSSLCLSRLVPMNHIVQHKASLQENFACGPFKLPSLTSHTVWGISSYYYFHLLCSVRVARVVIFHFSSIPAGLTLT